MATKQTLFKLDAVLPGLKDFILIVPFLATALAITYDVGFFAGIGMLYFTMFTLSEHIVFALEAVPFALIMIASIPVCLYAVSGLESITKKVVQENAGKGATEEERKQDVSVRRVAFVDVCVFLAGTLLAFVGYFTDSAIATIAGGCLLGTLLLVHVGASFEFVAIGSIFAGTFMLTLGLAIDAGRNTLKASAPTYTLETATGPLSGSLIRSGERGVLFFNRENREIVFARWDAISRIKTKMP